MCFYHNAPEHCTQQFSFFSLLITFLSIRETSLAKKKTMLECLRAGLLVDQRTNKWTYWVWEWKNQAHLVLIFSAISFPYFVRTFWRGRCYLKTHEKSAEFLSVLLPGLGDFPWHANETGWYTWTALWGGGLPLPKTLMASPSLSRPVRIFCIWDFYFCQYKIVYCQEILGNSELLVLIEASFFQTASLFCYHLQKFYCFTFTSSFPSNNYGFIKIF